LAAYASPTSHRMAESYTTQIANVFELATRVEE